MAESAWQKFRDNPLAGLAAIVAIVGGGGIVGLARGCDGDKHLRPFGKITSPARGALVSSPLTAEGALRNISADRTVWLALRVDRGLVFQRSAQLRSEDQSWSANLAQPKRGLGPDLGFSLVLLTVGASGHQQIVDSIRRGAAAGGSVLPSVSGSSQLAMVTGLTFSRCEHPPISSAARKGTVRIVGVRAGQLVPASINPLRGTYIGLGRGTNVWILVYSLTASKYYPQTHRDIGQGPPLHAELSPRGRFRSAASFGGATGEAYEVLAVLADRSATRFFTRKLQLWNRTNNFAGLKQGKLPRGLTETHCLPVILGSK